MLKNNKTRTKAFQKKTDSKNVASDPQFDNFDPLLIKQYEGDDYYQMLKTIPKKKIKENSFFESDLRYLSSNVIQSNTDRNQQLVVPFYNNFQNNLIQENEQEEPIKVALKELNVKRKKKSASLKEQVKIIEQEDNQFLIAKNNNNNNKETIEKAVSVKNQLNYYSKLIDVRYNKQKEMQNLKRFPKANFPLNQMLNESSKQFQTKIIQNIDILLNIFSNYATNSFQKQFITQANIVKNVKNQQQKQELNPLQNSLKIQTIYDKILQDTQEITKEVQKQLIRWSQKTTLLNQSTSSLHYSSLIMQTPVGQTKKIMANWERAQLKSQIKRSTFKILFEPPQNIRQLTDKQIYDDFDFFNQIERLYVHQIEEENQFRISDTQKYLKTRENKIIRKDVDRKASKNRKIKYQLHPKLINFMSATIPNEIEARDEIVKNLFNCKPKQEDSLEKNYIDM